jgi:hypothetical protein
VPWLLIVAAIVWSTQLPPCPDFLDGPCDPGYDPLPPLALLIVGIVGVLTEAIVLVARLPRKGTRVKPDDAWRRW